MSSNVQLAPPPLQNEVVDRKLNKITQAWGQWFDKVHYTLSTRNFQKITAATAVSPDAHYVSLVTAGSAYAITIAAPTIPGIRKCIEMITYDGSHAVTMTLTNLVIGGTAATTCTWNGARQSLWIESQADRWVVIRQLNVTLT